MHIPSYPIQSSDFTFTFEFISLGENRIINKLVKYQPTIYEGVVNLAFGDKNLITRELDDKVITNNGDIEKVLSTVVATIYEFTTLYPESWVFAKGSTSSRTRLYRIKLSKYLHQAEIDFEIFGEYNKN